MQLTENIETWITEKVGNFVKKGPLFLVECLVKGSHNTLKISVFLDGDKGISIGECAKVSRFIREELEKDYPGNDFAVDVSSPGVDQPLKNWRQYPKHLGRELQVTLENGKEIKGLFKALKPNHLVLEKKAAKKGKKQVQESVEGEIIVEKKDIKSTKVIVSFK